MKLSGKICLVVPILLLLLLSFLVIDGCTSSSKPIELNLSAGLGMRDALEAVNILYMRKHSNITITGNFAASGTLQKQIEQGAPTDVFISAAAAQMDALQKDQLLMDETRQNLLMNKVVLIVPNNSTLGLTSFNDLAGDKVKKIAMGDPSFVPAGTYAMQVFDELGITASVKSKEILAADVRQVLTYVEGGNVDAGIVFSTDALTSSKVKVVASAPTDINAKVVFPVAIIKTSQRTDAAKDYIAFLFGDEAKALFEKYGFSVVSK